MNGLVREMFVTWPVYREIAEYVSTADPRTADPQSVYGAACSVDPDRLAARIYGTHIGDTLEEAADLVEEVLAMAAEGRRPRFGRELGIGPELFREVG